MQRIDVLMITYNRPAYTRRSLEHLLGTCSDQTRVWLWHNGTHAPTLEIVRELADHPKVARFHHSPTNVGLQTPTNWLWRESDAPLLSKVDDDCLDEPGWDTTLAEAHAREPTLGVAGTWRFYDEDFVPELAERKITTLPGGTQLMVNPWVQGSGFLVKRECIDDLGLLGATQSFTAWCVQLALRGWTNGWIHPFVHEEHMDDPRSPHTALREDADLQHSAPLTAQRLGITTLDEWTERQRGDARALQAAPTDPRAFVGWRARFHRWRNRLMRRTDHPWR